MHHVLHPHEIRIVRRRRPVQRLSSFTRSPTQSLILNRGFAIDEVGLQVQIMVAGKVAASSVVRRLVEMLEPYKGRVYDPCCRSSGMFIQSIEFIRSHRLGNGNGKPTKTPISIYGQEPNYTAWRLAKMNPAIWGIQGQIAHGAS